jgi:hypothetical protein
MLDCGSPFSWSGFREKTTNRMLSFEEPDKRSDLISSRRESAACVAGEQTTACRPPAPIPDRPDRPTKPPKTGPLTGLKKGIITLKAGPYQPQRLWSSLARRPGAMRSKDGVEQCHGIRSNGRGNFDKLGDIEGTFSILVLRNK